MAWRIREHVLSGEVDNRTKGRVRGFLEWAGTGERILLDLRGNAHPDLAGSLIRFRNTRARLTRLLSATERRILEARGSLSDSLDP